MKKPPAKLGDRNLNPITEKATSSILFGYLDLTLGIVYAVNTQGRPDEAQVIGPHVKGTGDIKKPLGKFEGEAVLIKGKPHPICAGQYFRNGPRENERKNGVVLIDATAIETGPN